MNKNKDNQEKASHFLNLFSSVGILKPIIKDENSVTSPMNPTATLIPN